MVGLGTQDSFEQAQAFARQYRISFPMLWDRGYQSWAQLRIASQPAAILFSRHGTVVKRWSGPFNEAEAVRLARAA